MKLVAFTTLAVLGAFTFTSRLAAVADKHDVVPSCKSLAVIEAGKHNVDGDLSLGVSSDPSGIVEFVWVNPKNGTKYYLTFVDPSLNSAATVGPFKQVGICTVPGQDNIKVYKAEVKDERRPL